MVFALNSDGGQSLFYLTNISFLAVMFYFLISSVMTWAYVHPGSFEQGRKQLAIFKFVYWNIYLTQA